jgi:hypothetical protein
MLVLKPSLGMRVFAWAFLLLGTVPLAISSVFFFRHQMDTGFGVLVGFGIIFLVCGLLLLLLPSRQEFNLDKGQLIHRWLWIIRRRPLAEILAVQLIEGGWHTAKGQHGTQTTYFTYQLNLVLDNESIPRLNLTNHTHWDSTWQSGRDLADFLNVPFMDHVSQEEEQEEEG